MKNLSIRKYATLIGVSHTAVIKAIKNGYIVDGWNADIKKIIVPIANVEWGNSIIEKKTTGNTESEVEKKEGNFTTTHLTKQDYKPISEGISFSEARRKKETYNAEIARIMALAEQDIYVEKEIVYAQLFTFGQLLRVSFMIIPDRIIDDLIVSKSRSEAHSILLNEIHKTLEELTTLVIYFFTSSNIGNPLLLLYINGFHFQKRNQN